VFPTWWWDVCYQPRLLPGPRPCPECGGPRLVNPKGWEYEPGFQHLLTCVYRRAPTKLGDLGLRGKMRPHIQNWLLDDVQPLVDAYLAANGVPPTRLIIAPRFAPLFAIVATKLRLDVVGDLRCPPGQLFVVGETWDGRLE